MQQKNEERGRESERPCQIFPKDIDTIHLNITSTEKKKLETLHNRGVDTIGSGKGNVSICRMFGLWKKNTEKKRS